jgi:hypothetical protein
MTDKLCSTCLMGMKAPAGAPNCPTPGNQIGDEGCLRWKRLPVKAAALVKPPSLKSGHDAAAAKQLIKLFGEAQKGMRRITAVGLAAWEIKETQLKHGEFGAWLAAHAPNLSRIDDATGKPKASSALSSYMALTKGVLDHLGFTIEKYFAHVSKFPHAGICGGGKFLLLADKKVPEDVRPLREKICNLVDGKTAKQIFTEFKQVEEDDAGEVKPKRGRLKGEGGASKTQRENAQQLAEAARLEAIEIRAAEVTAWLLENADDKHLGQLGDKLRADLLDALDGTATYLRNIGARTFLSAATPEPSQEQKSEGAPLTVTFHTPFKLPNDSDPACSYTVNGWDHASGDKHFIVTKRLASGAEKKLHFRNAIEAQNRLNIRMEEYSACAKTVHSRVSA